MYKSFFPRSMNSFAVCPIPVCLICKLLGGLGGNLGVTPTCRFSTFLLNMSKASTITNRTISVSNNSPTIDTDIPITPSVPSPDKGLVDTSTLALDKEVVDKSSVNGLLGVACLVLTVETELESEVTGLGGVEGGASVVTGLGGVEGG